MLFFVRFDIHQPEAMSNREMTEISHREAFAGDLKQALAG